VAVEYVGGNCFPGGAEVVGDSLPGFGAGIGDIALHDAAGAGEWIIKEGRSVNNFNAFACLFRKPRVTWDVRK